MKSSLMGLITHPFSSPNSAKDLHGKPLKTDMRTVFRLSLDKDTDEYIYYLKALTKEEPSEPKETTPIVDSLKGSFKAPKDFDYKKELGNRLSEKYL